MYLLMALGAAVAYGAADFLGGLAARRSAVIPAILVSQSVGLIAVVLAAPLLAPIPDATPLAWGLAAGAGYGVGLVFLYGSLAKGRMSVAAPISAVCALALPVVFALALGEVPSRWAIVGILLAVGSIVLVSQDGADATRNSDPTKPERSQQGPNIIAMALAGGVGFGLFLTCLAQTKASAGLWPVVTCRTLVVLCTFLAALRTRGLVRIARPAFWAAVCGGALDVAGNVSYLLSARGSLLSLSSTLTSLYPASTVLLAAVVLRERIRVRQAIGLGCAAVAIALITAAA